MSASRGWRNSVRLCVVLSPNLVRYLVVPIWCEAEGKSMLIRAKSRWAVLLALLLPGVAITRARADILYATDDGGNKIVKFASNGASSVFASSGLSSPEGL